MSRNAKKEPVRASLQMELRKIPSNVGLDFFGGLLDVILLNMGQSPYMFPVLRATVDKLSAQAVNWKLERDLKAATEMLAAIKAVREVCQIFHGLNNFF